MPTIKAETVGPVTLVLADCLYGAHVGEFVPPGSAAAIITDPPYCSGGFTEASRRTSKSMGVKSEELGWFEGDNMTTLGLQFLLRAIAIDSWTMLRKGGTLSLFMDWRMIPAIAPAIESARLRWQQLVIWDKKAAGLGNGFRAQHETILHFSKGVPLYCSASNGNVLSVGRERDREHPTQKPGALLERIIETVAEPGALVVDWFGGAGSTGVAAIATGRRAVVFEVDPVFHARAVERCRAELGKGRLFSPTASKPEQDGLGLGDAIAVELADAPPVRVACPDCDGSGDGERIEGEGTVQCRRCNGCGLVTADSEDDLGTPYASRTMRSDTPSPASDNRGDAAAAIEEQRFAQAVVEDLDAFKTEAECMRCRGEGWILVDGVADDCPRCLGTGDAGVQDRCPDEHLVTPCPKCDGRLNPDAPGATCTLCHGYGSVNFYAIPKATAPRTCARTGQPLQCWSRLCAAAGRCTREPATAQTEGSLL